VKTVEISLDIRGLERSVPASASFPINPFTDYYNPVSGRSAGSPVHHLGYKEIYTSYSSGMDYCRFDYTGLCAYRSLLNNSGISDGPLV
jgi:hypothetical protein